MRILIAAPSSSTALSGVGRHALNLARCLLDHPAVDKVDLVVAPWQRELFAGSAVSSSPRFNLQVAAMRSGSFHRNLWYYRRLPALAAVLGADIVHLAYPVPVNRAAFTAPTVLTLHDLYPYEIPSNFGFPRALFNQAILQQCLRNVDSIACVSESTRLLLSRYASSGVQAKACRIYNCVDRPLEAAAGTPIQGWEQQPFLLTVAQHRSNKNLPFLVQVFDRLLRSGSIDRSMRLLVLGIAGPETRRIQQTIERTGLGDHVALMEGLPEAQLQWAYRNCSALVAPSITEGFGLPVAEALLAGCRVVCSDIPAFREIGLDHCRFIPLDREAEGRFAQAIAAAIAQPPATPVSLPQLSSSRIAEQYVRLYRSLLLSPQPAPETTLPSSPAATRMSSPHEKNKALSFN